MLQRKKKNQKRVTQGGEWGSSMKNVWGGGGRLHFKGAPKEVWSATDVMGLENEGTETSYLKERSKKKEKGCSEKQERAFQLRSTE